MALDLDEMMHQLTQQPRLTTISELYRSVIEAAIQLITAVTNGFKAQFVDVAALAVHGVGEIVRSVHAPTPGGHDRADIVSRCRAVDAFVELPSPQGAERRAEARRGLERGCKRQRGRHNGQRPQSARRAH